MVSWQPDVSSQKSLRLVCLCRTASGSSVNKTRTQGASRWWEKQKWARLDDLQNLDQGFLCASDANSDYTETRLSKARRQEREIRDDARIKRVSMKMKDPASFHRNGKVVCAID